MGHSFAGLADQYGGTPGPYTGPEPSEPDVTKSSGGQKWSQWLDYNQPGVGVIGAYQGGRYFDAGIYRPSLDSKMRTLGMPFDAVGREQIILDIYKLVRPLDSWLSNTVVQTNPASLWVDSVDPSVIDVEWRVNGQLVAGAQGESFRLRDYGYGPGTYTVTARAFDPTDWVRINLNLLQESIVWNVVLTTILGDVNNDGVVDIFDINWISSHWSQVGGGSAVPVPEPSTLALTLIGVIGIVAGARRRRTV